MKKQKNLLAMISIMLLATVLLMGCGGKNYEKELVGSWYAEGDEPVFTFYDDGTCEIDIYGYTTGEWAVVNENQLKLTVYFDEFKIYPIISLDKGCLTINIDGDSVQLWDSPQE